MDGTYRIVVGVDGSDASRRALEWAVGAAADRGGAVQAVLAYEWPATEAALLAGLSPTEEQARAEGVLADAARVAGAHHPEVPIAMEVVTGDPAHRLTDISSDADLLVVGSRGHGWLHHAVLGSVSEACIRMADCPVVVIPPPHHQRHHPGGVPATAHG